VYWRGDPWLGLGNGAHSYADPIRRWNEREWDRYSSAVGGGGSPEAERESVDDEARRLEKIWLGLRTVEGIAEPTVGSPADDLVSEWVADGLAHRNEGRVALTVAGWLVLDRLAVELDARDGAFDLR
jgi:oxygen-independent coproporphyrinogen-3 oxidase